MKRHKRVPSRAGFTLLELMIVIVIVGIIASIAAAAYINAMRTARVTATESMLRLVDDSLSDRLESFFANVRGATVTASTDATNIATATGSSMNNARAKVIEKLERMRAAFPQEYREFMTIDPAGAEPVPGGYSFTTKGPITAYQNAVMEVVNRHRNAGQAVDTPEYAKRLLENESAECLYLILRHYSREAMGTTIDDIPTRFIKDTDGDEMLEIVDAWERPVRFYRWPTDLLAYYIELEKSIPQEWLRVSNIDSDATLLEDVWYSDTTFDFGSTDLNGRGGFENITNSLTSGGTTVSIPSPRARYFRLHAAYADTTDPSSGPGDPTIAGNKRSYPILPVIVSAGPDGEFGMHLEPTTDATEPTDLSVRCGRVDGSSPDTLEQFNDNVVSIKVRAGTTQ